MFELETEIAKRNESNSNSKLRLLVTNYRASGSLVQCFKAGIFPKRINLQRGNFPLWSETGKQRQLQQ